jgi:hypothetical protein
MMLLAAILVWSALFACLGLFLLLRRRSSRHVYLIIGLNLVFLTGIFVIYGVCLTLL